MALSTDVGGTIALSDGESLAAHRCARGSTPSLHATHVLRRRLGGTLLVRWQHPESPGRALPDRCSQFRRMRIRIRHVDEPSGWARQATFVAIVVGRLDGFVSFFPSCGDFSNRRVRSARCPIRSTICRTSIRRAFGAELAYQSESLERPALRGLSVHASTFMGESTSGVSIWSSMSPRNRPHSRAFRAL